MKWIKKGLIFNPENLGGWRAHTFITPTPFLLTEDVIRVYGGFRDELGVSRIGFIDVRADNPLTVLRISETPALDIGKDGMFDDNGVILGSIIRNGNEIWMYYVGFQLVKKVKFLAFSGLAISNDGGESFRRVIDTPILDRYKDEHYIRAIHSVIKEGNVYKIWYSTGNRWEIINDIPYPQYKIMYIESSDGITIPLKDGEDCIDVVGDEYRIGRPTVFGEDGYYKMFYTKDTFSKKYSAGYAESFDGKHWTRKEEEFNLPLSPDGWDSEMICYPVPITTKYGTYLFYSGNNMGQSGVGYAIDQPI
ncbi:MAG: hypothetical protein EOO13_00905 [Chitinophagaceae bacterium]|nr:MAG: hypothetical protein EOO13_00905 [Chitinophagaceae bacterium]